MKRKTITTAISAVLGLSLLSACGTNYKVTFYDFWKKSIETTILQTVTETCAYDVSFTAGANDSYTVNYQNGTYKTTFISETNGNQTQYTYKTEMTVQVQYKVGEQTSAWLDDSMTSTVKFQSSQNGLKPISAEKRGKTHSPTAITAGTLESAYVYYDLTVKTDYSEACDSATTTITNNEKTENNVQTNSFSIKHDTYNYLDNEQLVFALRCVDPAASSAQRFQVYAPFNQGIQTIYANYGTEATADFEVDIDGNKATRKITYYPTTMKIGSQGNNSGATQTLWIAKTDNPQNNTYRNVILRQETPLAYNLGTLVFNLKTVTFANA